MIYYEFYKFQPFKGINNSDKKEKGVANHFGPSRPNPMGGQPTQLLHFYLIHPRDINTIQVSHGNYIENPEQNFYFDSHPSPAMGEAEEQRRTASGRFPLEEW